MTAMPEMTLFEDDGLTRLAMQLSSGSEALFEQYDPAPAALDAGSVAEDAYENLYPSPR